LQSTIEAAVLHMARALSTGNPLTNPTTIITTHHRTPGYRAAICSALRR